MNKFFKNIFILAGLIFIAYYIYLYFQSDFVPSQSRHFYKSRTLPSKEIQVTTKELTIPNAIQVKHPELNVRKDALANLMLKFKGLKKLDEECEKTMSSLIPKDEMIDPRSKHFLDKEKVVAKLHQILKEMSPRVEVGTLFVEFGAYLKTQESIEASQFTDFLTQLLICRRTNISFYVENLFEAMDTREWDSQVRLEVHNAILSSITTSIESDKLPDNLIYNLNILRMLGMSTKQGDGYYAEIDSIYSRLADFEEKFFEENERGMIYSPIQKYDDYNNELDYITEEIKYLLARRYEK